MAALGMVKSKIAPFGLADGLIPSGVPPFDPFEHTSQVPTTPEPAGVHSFVPSIYRLSLRSKLSDRGLF